MATISIGPTAVSPAPTSGPGENVRPASVRQDASIPKETPAAPLAPRAPLAPEANAPPAKEQVQQALADLRKSLSPAVASGLQFAIDEDTGQTLVRVTDAKTGELIRQIPSEEMVELAKSLDKMQGTLIRQKA